MARAAKAAQAGGGGTAVPSRLFVLRTFDVWHREQMVTVQPGEVQDAGLAATLCGIHDPSLLEWRA